MYLHRLNKIDSFNIEYETPKTASDILDDILQLPSIEDREAAGNTDPVYLEFLEKNKNHPGMNGDITRHPLYNFKGYHQDFIDKIKSLRENGTTDFELLMHMSNQPLTYIDNKGMVRDATSHPLKNPLMSYWRGKYKGIQEIDYIKSFEEGNRSPFIDGMRVGFKAMESAPTFFAPFGGNKEINKSVIESVFSEFYGESVSITDKRVQDSIDYDKGVWTDPKSGLQRPLEVAKESYIEDLNNDARDFKSYVDNNPEIDSLLYTKSQDIWNQ